MAHDSSMAEMPERPMIEKLAWLNVDNDFQTELNAKNDLLLR